MTNRLDAQQLDQVWDASVLGQPLPFPVQDPEELRLFELLAEVDRPAPDPAFFRALERELALAVPVEAIAAPSARSPEPNSRTQSQVAHSKHRSPTRMPIPAYAMAAVALLLILSTVVIALPRFGSENERSISAVSGWEEDNSLIFGGEGGSSQSILSPSAAVETLFSQTLDQAELERYQSGDWSWIGITRGTIEPGEESVIVPSSPVAYDPDYTGIGAIFVEQGALAASVDAGAWILRGNGESTTRIDERTTVTLDAGDTLFLPPSALPALWNSGESEANYLAGGVYTSGSSYPLNEHDTRTQHGGTTVDPNDLAIGIPLTMSMEHISIGPGASYSYRVSSETWLMALVSGDGLQKRAQINGSSTGSVQTLVPSAYSLHQDGFGDYTLFNSGSETVDIYFYRVEPLSEPMPEATPNALSNALLDSTLTPELLQGYRFDDWRWIQFNRNAVFPQGDSTEFAQLMLAGWNVVPGLNVW
jgi:hypothetical protein